MERKKKEPLRHQLGLAVGSDVGSSKSLGESERSKRRSREPRFYPYWKYDRLFLRKVYYQIFNYIPPLGACINTVDLNDTSEYGGKELTPEEVLQRMEKTVYYNRHYYIEIDDPTRLSFTYESFNRELDNVKRICPLRRKTNTMEDIIKQLETDWIERGYQIEKIEDTDIDPAQPNPSFWEFNEETKKYHVKCSKCGKEFESELQEALFSIGGGGELHVYGAVCPECGEFVSEKIRKTFCRYCGKEFEIKGHEAGRYREFCSDECYHNYVLFERRFNWFVSEKNDDSSVNVEALKKWRELGVSPLSIETTLMRRYCRFCGKVIPLDKNIKSKYCDTSCKNNFIYRLNKEKKTDPNITEERLVEKLKKERTQGRDRERALKMLKSCLIGGVSFDNAPSNSVMAYLIGFFGDEFSQVVDEVTREIEVEKDDLKIKDKNVILLTRLITRGVFLDDYPGSEPFYLRGYFGEEFNQIVEDITTRLKLDQE